ncbi:CoA transferase [Bosea sp. BK604]|uniref:CoA transferase n=1 Tax=Bosea sp. BK604 TaxID=2512180 RepID=UPI0010E615EF|nr:CoA transferase [Bosea sp. BK604]TCR70653.1 crotonobetainyl-CoA:carnitine CoA-transferase CaiB-like acyl-CoA transferase [Bosea sp. BK604]
MSGTTAPLAGLHIIEAVAGSVPDALRLAIGLCGRIAADLGANVIRLEDGDCPQEEALFLHPGKRRFSVRADAKPLMIRDLAAKADVLICDPLTAAALPQLDGGLVEVIIEMAQDTPVAGSEFTIGARSGLLDLVGDAARQPLRIGGHQNAYAAGLAAYLAMTSGLLRRAGGEAPPPMTVGLLDVAVWLNWKTLAIADRSGVSPSRNGPNSEWTILPCADGYFALVYRVPEWPALMRFAAAATLSEERFQTPAGRSRHRSELNQILTKAFAGRSRADIRLGALEHKLPLGPVWTPEELLGDPHMLAREFFHLGPEGGPARARVPVRWNGASFTPGADYRPVAGSSAMEFA